MTASALILANGAIEDGPMVQRALTTAGAALVVAADGGARAAQHYGLHIDVVVGDMDSLSDDELRALVAAGAQVQRHPPEKDYTDLELALYYVAERDMQWIRIIGGLGNRLDQTLGNLYLMAVPELQGRDVRLVAGKQESCLLHPGQHTIHGQPGDTISLLPMGGPVSGIRTENLHYPLYDETLEFGPARGISNVMTAETAQVTTQSGKLLVVHTIGRA